MPFQPKKNTVTLCSRFEFKKLCLQAVKSVCKSVRKVRLHDEIFRKMRSSLLLGASSKTQLEEALTVIIDAIAKKVETGSGVVTVRYADVEALVFPDENNTEGEQEWNADKDLAAAPMWGVRRILDRFKRDGKTYYLVDWQPTEEPREHIPINLIPAFNRERRALVRRTYIEDEAEEA